MPRRAAGPRSQVRTLKETDGPLELAHLPVTSSFGISRGFLSDLLIGHDKRNEPFREISGEMETIEGIGFSPGQIYFSLPYRNSKLNCHAAV